MTQNTKMTRILNLAGRRALGTAALLLLAACASPGLSSRMASWHGSELADLERAWGPADECVTLDGRALCRWRDTQTQGLAAAVHIDRVTCVRTVEVDAQSVVIGWRWRGDNCARYAQTVLARHEFHPAATNVAQVVDASGDE